MKKLSVIIVSYNGKEMLYDCLKSIEKYNDIGEQLEVIVSDNSPDDQVVEMVQAEFPEVVTVHNPLNGGFGYGNNRGAEIAQGNYFLFLNPDTLLVEPIFKYCMDQFEMNENLALFGIKQITDEYASNFSFYLLDGIGILDGLYQRYCQKKDKFIDGRMFIPGSDMFIRKDIFSAIGMFDENLFMFYEESDILRRVKMYSSDLITAYFPEKKLIHLVGGTRKRKVSTDLNSIRLVLTSLRYYCGKYQLNYKKMIRKYIRLSYLRKLKYLLVGNREQVNEFYKIIDYSKELLNK